MPQTTHKTPHIPLLEIIDSRYDIVKAKLDNIEISDTGCWEYQGNHDCNDTHSYGRISILLYGRKYRFRAHRLSYAFYNGVDPKELFVCHKCDNTLCINPDHLFLGTMSDNMRDMVAKERNRAQDGERNFAAKLKERDVKQIIARIKAGETNKAIAAKLPVTHSLVSLIRRGKLWSEVSRSVGYVPGKKYERCRRAA